MSKFDDLVDILGDEELAKKILENAQEKSYELEVLGVAFKNLDDIEGQLEGLSFSELRELKDMISKLLTEHKYPKSEQRRPKTVKLTYEPDEALKSLPFHPRSEKVLAQSGTESIELINRCRAKAEKAARGKSAIDLDIQAGIERIQQSRGEIKTKAGYISPLDKSFQQGIDDIETSVRRRKHKGPGRWSHPPIELTGSASVEAIMRWRQERKKERIT